MGSVARRGASISTITAIGEVNAMRISERKPVSVGEILREEYLGPLGLTQAQLAEAMGVPRKHVNELCRDRRAVTADTALILGRVFGTSADFWLNVQRRTELWQAMSTPERRGRRGGGGPQGKHARAARPH
jgi:addiction module HigA family antidote